MNFRLYIFLRVENLTYFFRKMGIIKNIFKPVVKDAEHMVYQTKALLKQDKISKGEKVLAPKHPTDEAHFKEAQKDDKIREVCTQFLENYLILIFRKSTNEEMI